MKNAFLFKKTKRNFSQSLSKKCSKTLFMGDSEALKNVFDEKKDCAAQPKELENALRAYAMGKNTMKRNVEYSNLGTGVGRRNKGRITADMNTLPCYIGHQQFGIHDVVACMEGIVWVGRCKFPPLIKMCVFLCNLFFFCMKMGVFIRKTEQYV